MNGVQNIQLKYGNTKLLGNTKCNQVKLVLAVFTFVFCTKLAIIYIEQARYIYFTILLLFHLPKGL